MKQSVLARKSMPRGWQRRIARRQDGIILSGQYRIARKRSTNGNMMFIDEAQIQVSSGKGGDGAVHFRRRVGALWRPDGGDGGRGGDVILEVKPTLNTLSTFQYAHV
jgi:hypothetical protein